LSESYPQGKIFFLAGKETTWGESVSPTKDLGLHQSADVTEASNTVYSYGFGSANAAARATGKYDVTISTEIQVQHGRFLEYGCARGATVNDAGAGDPYTHTFTPSDTGALTPFTSQFSMDGAADILWRARGCLINSFTLKQDLDGVLTSSLDLIAKAPIKSSSVGTVVVDTLPTFPQSYATLSFGAEGAEAAQSMCQNFEWTHNNNIIKSHGFGSRLPAAAVAGKAEEKFTFSAVFESTTALERFWGAASAPIDGAVTEGGLIFSTSDATPTRKIEVDFNNATFDEHRKSYPLDNVVMQDISGTARSVETITCMDDIDNWL